MDHDVAFMIFHSKSSFSLSLSLSHIDAFLLAEKIPSLDEACMTLLNLHRVERLHHQLHLRTKNTDWKQAKINSWVSIAVDWQLHDVFLAVLAI